MWELESDEPFQDAPSRNRDETGWAWEIRRGDDSRRIAVYVTGQAREAGRAEVVEAIETRGRSVMLTILDRDDPPGTVTLTQDDRIEEPYQGSSD